MDARVRYHIFLLCSIDSGFSVRCALTYDFMPGLLCPVQLYHSRFTYAQLNEFVMRKKNARFLAAIPEGQ